MQIVRISPFVPAKAGTQSPNDSLSEHLGPRFRKGERVVGMEYSK